MAPQPSPPQPAAPADASARPAKEAQGSDFVNLSGFASLRDIDDAPKPDVRFSRQAQRNDTPRPWMRLPLYKRVFVVPYLWALVVLDYARRILLGVRWLGQHWIKERPGALVQAGETVFWPLVFVALSSYSNPTNPFYVNEGFPWPWIGVWLIALRYGSLSGVVAALLMLGLWYVLMSTMTLPRSYFLGGAIMTLIAGEFGNLWGGRSSRQREVMRYLDEKMERLTRRLYLLKLSHDELEYEMVERPSTLRDALAELQGKLNSAAKDRERLPSAQVMMAFLAAHTQIEAGGMYEYVDGPRPKILRVSHVGVSKELHAEDPMVRRAIESRQSVHLLEQLTELCFGEQVLVVCPMFDGEGDPLGVVAVHRLPFMAFNSDNLRNLGVLVEAYSEYVRLRKFGSPLLSQWPRAPTTLVHEFAWLQRMRRDHGIDSGCLVWRADGPQADVLLDAVRSVHNNGSMAWQLGYGATVCLVTLVPFVTARRLTGHQLLVREDVRKRVGGQVEALHLSCTQLTLADSDAWADLRDSVGGVAL